MINGTWLFIVTPHYITQKKSDIFLEIFADFFALIYFLKFIDIFFTDLHNIDLIGY